MATLTSDNIATVFTKLVFNDGGVLKDTSASDGTADAEIQLASPKINVDAALTANSNELNALDGIDFALGGAAKLNQAILRDQANDALGTAKASTNLTLNATLDATGMKDLTGTGTFQAGILTATASGAIPALVSTTSVTTPLVTHGSAVNLTAGAASTWKTTAGNLTVDSLAGNLVLDGHGGVDIDSANGGITIDGLAISVGTASDVPIDIDASTLDIDTSTNITMDTELLSIDSTNTTNLTMTADDGSDKTMTIAASNSGGGAGNIAITADTTTFTGTVVGDNNTTYTSSNFLENGATTTLGATTTVTTAASKNFNVSGAGLANLTSTANSTNAVLLYANSANSKVNIESNVSTASDSVKVESNHGGIKVLAEAGDANGKVLIQGNGSGYGIDLLGNSAPVQVTRGSTGRTDHLRFGNTSDAVYSNMGFSEQSVAVGQELQFVLGLNSQFALLFIRKTGGFAAADYCLGMASTNGSGAILDWVNISGSLLAPIADIGTTAKTYRIRTSAAGGSDFEIIQLAGQNYITSMSSSADGGAP